MERWPTSGTESPTEFLTVASSERAATNKGVRRREPRADGDPRAAAGRAAQVLAVGTRCPRHPAARGETRQEPPTAPTSRAHSGSLTQPLGAHHGRDDLDNDTYVTVPTIQESGPPGSRRDDEARLVVADTLKSQRGKDGGGIGPEETLIAMNLRGREGGAMPEMDSLASLRAANGGSSRSYVAAPLTSGAHPNSNAPGRRMEDDENLVTAFSHTQGLDPQASGEVCLHATNRRRRPGPSAWPPASADSHRPNASASKDSPTA